MIGTAFGQAPENDVCSLAVPVTCGSAYTGSTTLATNDDDAFTCGTIISAPGVWYVFEGDGQAVTLSTCPEPVYDTKLNVYSGTCDALDCVVGNDDGGDCGLGSTVGFLSEVGTTYYILVQGFDGEVGDFELTVSCAEATYDFCSEAVPIACGEELQGSTLEATTDIAPQCGTGIQAPGVWYTFTGISDEVIVSTCFDFDYDTRLNVYEGTCDGLVCVDGNDDVAGSTCSSVNFVPDANTTYYVLVQGYQGATGNFTLGLVCLTCGTPTQINVAALDQSATVSWTSANDGAGYTVEYGPAGFEPGTGMTLNGTVSGTSVSVELTGLDISTDYEVYIQEDCGNEDLSLLMGPYDFTTLAMPPPANAYCAGATPVNCGDPVDGDTSVGLFTAGPACGAANITSKGLWYSFVGTGEVVLLSTCGSAAYDTKISVFSGACGDLSCVAGGDDATNCPGNTTTVEFLSEVGTDYLILVHGYGQASGTFTMNIFCEAACTTAANDLCENASEVPVVGFGLCEGTPGSNDCAYAPVVPNPPCDLFGQIVDIWFMFNTGENADHTVSIAAVTAGEVNAALYADCGDLEYVGCETEIAGPLDLTGLELNTTYYLRVWNAGGELAGSFNVCVETDLTTGIVSSTNTSNVRLYPNPANDQLTIEGNMAERIALIDLQGRTVLTTSTNGAELVRLDIANLAPGSYVLQALDNGTTLGRFVKN
ncbi:MAG: T9SS type A sorting domain-containing protein [Flavobacteriales bacterium]